MIIFSPAKEFNLNTNHDKKLNFLFKKETNLILDYLSNKSLEELEVLLKIKNKTLSNTYDYYNKFPYCINRAIFLYNGVAYKEIKSYDNDYINKNVFILSAFYGLLNGNDLIAPYRLDYTTKLEFDNYKIYKEKINDYLLNDLKPDYILNLSSKEFSKIISINKLNCPFYDLEFKSNKKVSSVALKKIRGQVLNYCIENKVFNIKDLEKFSSNLINSIVIKDYKVIIMMEE